MVWEDASCSLMPDIPAAVCCDVCVLTVGSLVYVDGVVNGGVSGNTRIVCNWAKKFSDSKG
jgi:hypothetical protein